MRREDILKLPSMPAAGPSYPAGPYRFIHREFMVITYETDPDIVREHLPEPLEPTAQPLVHYEWIKMPDSSGFGDYTESGQMIPVTFDGRPGAYVHSMYLNDESPIAGGREIWGFPKKLADPCLRPEKDTLCGTLDYGPVRIATGTMGYKHRALDLDEVKRAFLVPNYTVKIIPDADCSPRICELVRFHLEDLTIKGAWSGPAALELYPHALAPVAALPVLEVVSAIHVLTDLTLGLGEVVHDYLKS